jgi:hypothetical protein
VCACVCGVGLRFRERRSFYFNLKTKVCTVQPLNHRFQRFGIPKNATFIRDSIIGTNAFPDSGLLTTHWEDSKQGECMPHHSTAACLLLVYMRVEPHGCIHLCVCVVCL